MVSRFKVTGNFGTSAPTAPEMRWTLKVPQTSSASIAQVTSSSPFCSMTSLFQAYRMILKWPWTLWGERYTICIVQLPLSFLESPKFQSVSLYGKPFSSYLPLWENAQNDLKGNLNCKRSKYLKYHIPLHRRVPNFNLCNCCFRVTSHFAKNTLSDFNVTLNTVMPNVPVPPSPKFQSGFIYSHPFSSYRPFRDKCTEWLQMTLST